MLSINEKRGRSAERTKACLLEAGTALFSAQGYHGTSVDEIVGLADVNKRMLYHYFKNKEGLYSEVLRSVFSKLQDLELSALESTDSATEAVAAIIEVYFKFLHDNPDFVRLLMWENLHQGRFLSGHELLLSKVPVLKKLEEVIRRGQASGEIVENIDVRHLMINLIGVCSIYHTNRYTLSHSMKLRMDRPSVLRKGLQSAQSIILAGLRKKSV